MLGTLSLLYHPCLLVRGRRGRMFLHAHSFAFMFGKNKEELNQNNKD